MSLNFVSTSVLSSTDGVSHNTETVLDPSSSTSANHTYQKPLYEQLRDNSEKDQEKYDEITKAMRGTTTLNEEDVAFIHSVEDRKAKKKNDVKRKEEEEIQMFRAARLEKNMTRSESILVNDEADEDRGTRADISAAATAFVVQNHSKVQSSLVSTKPKIVRKRRRKIVADLNAESSEEKTKKMNMTKRMRQSDTNYGKLCKEEDSSISNQTDSIAKTEVKEDVSALCGLLAYGSDSDSD
jgi:hypothetical protein